MVDRILLKPRGFIELLQKDSAKGHTEWQTYYKGENLVVNNYRTILAYLLAGDIDYRLFTLKLGTCGHTPGDLYTPRVEGVDDFVPTRTDLFSNTGADPQPNPSAYVFSKSYNPDWSVSYIDNGSETSGVRFTVSINAGEANDDGSGNGYVRYTEAGMFSNNPELMFSLKTFPVFVKAPTSSWLIKWGFEF